jgi:hypothetical protein
MSVEAGAILKAACIQAAAVAWRATGPTEGIAQAPEAVAKKIVELTIALMSELKTRKVVS